MSCSLYYKHLRTTLDAYAKLVNNLANRELLYREFGIRLATERKRKRLSQAQLGELANLSRTSITNIECGRQPIQLHQLYIFASLLRVDAHSLLPKESALVPEPSITIETKEARYLAAAMKLLKAAKPTTGETHG
jgi:transcriptional regulator with XRE-family HTH domain